MSGCGDETRDEPGGGAEEERTHDDGLRNHDDAAREERHRARWRWYGCWQHRSGCGEEEDAPVCVTATIVAQLEKEKVLGSSDSDSGKGKSKMSKHITHGFHLVKGRSDHEMEDYHVAQFKQIDNNELGLFAIFDGHSGHSVPNYLRSHLFDNIIKEPDFWTDPAEAIKRAYNVTDSTILEKSGELGRGGSTAVTAILINCQKLVVANIGDSRAVLCKNGVTKQLSVDHEPNIESDVPRVNGQLAVSRAFGDKSLKKNLSSEPYVTVKIIDMMQSLLY